MNARFLLLLTTVLATPAFAQQQADVVHSWTTGTEAAAVQALADVFAANGGTWVDVPVAGPSNATATAVNRIVGGTPPAAFRLSVGGEILTMAEQGLLRPIEVEGLDLDATIPTVFQAGLKYEDEYYGIPLNVQSVNWVFASTKALTEAGVTEYPTDLDSFFAALDALKAAGKIPFAQTGIAFFEEFVFNEVLLASGGLPLYQQFIRDHDGAAIDSPEFVAATEAYARLRGYTDPGMPGRNWTDTANLVINGDAGFILNGDWANAAFTSAGLVAGTDYECNIGFASHVMVMGSDALVFPTSGDAELMQAQDLLAATAISLEGQINFNSVKGSVPVRTDVDTSALNSCLAKAVAFVGTEGGATPWPSYYNSPERNLAVRDLITGFWNTPSMTAEQFRAQLKSTNAQYPN